MFPVFPVFMKRKAEEALLDPRPRKKRRIDLRGRQWFLTWNNHDSDSIKVLLRIGGISKYVIQEEVGSSGTKHLQGLMVFENAKLMSTLVNHVGGLVHWEKVRNLLACKNYCSKVDSSCGQLWTKGFGIPQRVKDPLMGKELYAYQKEVLELVKQNPDDRSIYWYWSKCGNVGKSALCKHLCLKHDAIVVGGSFKDAYYAIIQRVKAKKAPSLVCFSLCRSQGNKVSYIGIEGIKDGMFFSAKYESGMCVYNPPHVLVFANEPPVMEQLSVDRWNIKCLDKEDDLQGIASGLPYDFSSEACQDRLMDQALSSGY